MKKVKDKIGYIISYININGNNSVIHTDTWDTSYSLEEVITDIYNRHGEVYITMVHKAFNI